MYGLRFIMLLLMGLGLTACQSYRMGRPELAQSVGLLPIKNEAYVAQAEFLLAENTLQELLRDRSIGICDVSDADWLLEVTISEFKRSEGASASNDTGRAASFKLQLSAEVKVLDSVTRAVLKKDVLEADTVVYTEQGLVLAERNAMVVLARDLGQQIRDFLLADW